LSVVVVSLDIISRKDLLALDNIENTKAKGVDFALFAELGGAGVRICPKRSVQAGLLRIVVDALLSFCRAEIAKQDVHIRTHHNVVRL
jgi:hypothetical protein